MHAFIQVDAAQVIPSHREARLLMQNSFVAAPCRLPQARTARCRGRNRANPTAAHAHLEVAIGFEEVAQVVPDIDEGAVNCESALERLAIVCPSPTSTHARVSTVAP
jgi:hypothetical protein